MHKTHDAALLKRRKFLVVLPLLVIPFITMGFWFMGGGSKPAVAKVQVNKGFNLVLPDAEVKSVKTADKMALYGKAQKDSLDLVKQGIALSSEAGLKADPSELAIQTKLAQISAQVAVKPGVGTVAYGTGNVSVRSTDPGMSADVAKLEALMKNMQASGGADDPEMRQLNSMMDKILAIQNPGLLKQNIVKPLASDSVFMAVPAEVSGSQRIIQGAVVKMKLLDSLWVKGELIPKGHLVYALAEFGNQRLKLTISHIRLGNQIIPVSLTVFDQRDGMEGIFAPEAILTDALNGGSSDAISTLGIGSFDQSLPVQLAGVGIDAAKGLLTKRLKKLKQKLVSGYPLLLRDNSKKIR